MTTPSSLDPYEPLYATRIAGLRSSAMRDLMAVTARPEVISLAGGLPYTQAFPPDVLIGLVREIADARSAEALQYGPTEGLDEARAAICRMLARGGTPAVPEHVIVTTGGQQVLDLVCRLLVDPGDAVIAEGPTYPGMVPTLMAYQADVRHVELDRDGMRIDRLADELDRLDREGRAPKLIYAIPTFQNPAGATLSRGRREELLAVAAARGIPVLEDDPYGPLRFEGESLPTLLALDGEAGNVIHAGTFSKVLAPGLRLGFVVAPPAIAAKLNLLKQGVDLCSSPLAQMVAAAFVDGPRFEPYVHTLVELYRERRDVMLAAIRDHLPADTAVTPPAGGLFLWLQVPGISTPDLLPRALAAGVAFVPGTAAYLDGRGADCMRMNFSAVTADRIVEGVRRLGSVVAEQRRIRTSLLPSRPAWRTSAS